MSNRGGSTPVDVEEWRARYRGLAEVAEGAVYELDPEGCFTAVDEEIVEATGYERDVLENAHAGLLLDEDDLAACEAAIDRCLDPDGPDRESVVVTIHTAGGESFSAVVRLHPLVVDGTFVGTVGVADDLPERSPRGAALGADLDDLFDRFTDAFFALDREWRFTYVNQRAEEALDVDGEDVLGESVWEAFPGAVDSVFQRKYEEAMATQETVTFEAHYDPLDTWFEVHAYPSETGLSVYFRDVTERKHHERTLERYHTLTQAVADAIVTVDESGTIQSVNPSVEDVFGYDPDDLVGEPLTTLVPDRLTEPHLDGFERYLETGEKALDWNYVELPGQHRDGHEVSLAISFSEYEFEGERYFTGVLRDISERVEHREELAERERALRRAYEVIADADRAFAEKIDALLDVVRDTVGTDYATLSRIHDEEYVFEAVATPPDADLEAGDTVPLRATNCERTVRDEEVLVLNDVERDAPELADRAGNAEWGISCYLGAPVFVDGEVYGTFCFYDMEAHPDEFTDWEVTFVDLLSNWVGYELERRRNTERLAALDHLNCVVRDITDAVLRQSSREEVERLVCERLAESDSFEFAWTGETVDGEVVTRAEAGVDGYLDDAHISLDDEGSPAARAIRTQEVQVARDVPNDPSFEKWHEHAERYGFRSSAAVPIVHEGTVYGLLKVYSTRPTAFGDHERDVFSHLGHTIGHAINAIEQRRALIGDEVVEVEFRISDYLDDIPEATGEGTVDLRRFVPTGDDEFVGYGTASPAAVDDLHALATHAEFAESLRILAESDDGVRFELDLDDPPMSTTVADRNGRVRSVTFDDGDLEFVCELPAGDHVRPTVEAIESSFPGVEIVAQRREGRSRDPDHRLVTALADDLTDRQRAVLEAAYFGGYFEWPRSLDGGELADAMDVSAPTVHQHLRTAQRKLLRALFETE